MDKPEKRRMIYVIGCPGSGKGTLCKRLAEAAGFRHLSVGDLLRQQERDGKATDPQILDCLRAGTLVPVDLLAGLLEITLPDREDKSYEGVLLDGFPRHIDQIQAVQKVTGPPCAVFFFNCPKDIARHRVMYRLLPGRDQDETVFERRYAEFCLNNPGIVEYYQDKQLLIEVDTSGETSVSYELLLKALKNSGLVEVAPARPGHGEDGSESA